MNRWPQISSFILFIVLCMSIAYWAMQIYKPPQRAIAAPSQTGRSASLDAAAGLFGGRSSFAVSSNFQLTGVVVANDPLESVAILAVNGKPAQAVSVNKEIVPGVTVKEVHKGYVLMLEGGVVKRVELPVDVRRRQAVSR